VDGIGTRACPSSARFNLTSRQQPTCDDKPGHDDLGRNNGYPLFFTTEPEG
jgi:hypothetical protein